MNTFFIRKQHFTVSGIILFVLVLLFASCGSNHSVVSSFGKRKYTKGFFLFSSAKLKEVKAAKANTVAVKPKAIREESKKEEKIDRREAGKAGNC